MVHLCELLLETLGSCPTLLDLLARRSLSLPYSLKITLQCHDTLVADLEVSCRLITGLGHARQLLSGSSQIALQRLHQPATSPQIALGLVQKLGAFDSIRLKLVTNFGSTTQIGAQLLDPGTSRLQLLLCCGDITLYRGQTFSTCLQLLGRLLVTLTELGKLPGQIIARDTKLLNLKSELIGFPAGLGSLGKPLLQCCPLACQLVKLLAQTVLLTTALLQFLLCIGDRLLRRAYLAFQRGQPALTVSHVTRGLIGQLARALQLLPQLGVHLLECRQLVMELGGSGITLAGERPCCSFGLPSTREIALKGGNTLVHARELTA